MKLRACVSKLGIAFGNLFRIPYAVSIYIKQSHNPDFTKSHSYVIGAFHRALGGRMFRHKLQENGGNVACPIASKCNIGLGPSHTNPQLIKTSMDSDVNCFTNFAKNEQLKHQNTSMESQITKGNCTYLWGVN